LYGYETWFLTLREKHRVTIFENRALRRIFELKRDKVTRGRRKLRNTDLHNLYSLPDIFRMIKSRSMRLARHVGRMGRIIYKILMGNFEGRRRLGIPSLRWG
jgi:hypothetical protein